MGAELTESRNGIGESPAAIVKNIRQPYLSANVIWDDGDYKRQVLEWLAKDFF